MVYEMIRKQVITENEARCKNMLEAIKEEESVLKRESTPTRWEQFQRKRITYSELIEYTSKRIKKQHQKQASQELEQLEAIGNAPMPEAITIIVNWKKSRTWDYNPSTEITDGKNRYFGSASGCGYDKESAAIAEVLNQSMSCLKILCNKKELELKKGKTGTNHDLIGYGSGYYAIPKFEGGVGMSCFVKILQEAGYKYTHAGNNSTDVYNFYK